MHDEVKHDVKRFFKATHQSISFWQRQVVHEGVRYALSYLIFRFKVITSLRSALIPRGAAPYDDT